jgi:acetyl esterase/lipase
VRAVAQRQHPDFTLERGELDSKDPLVSPLYADLTGLASMVVFSGTHDIHNPDACDFAARARDAGVSLDYHEEPGALHVYPLLPTAEGASARNLMAALVGSAAVGETRASRQDETVQQSALGSGEKRTRRADA